MLKVAIVTIYSRNYGNRLQNYALQEFLKSINVHCETIPLKKMNTTILQFKKWIISLLNIFITRKLNVKWYDFDKTMTWSKYTSKNRKIVRKYDFFIAGSDQIWNPFFYFNSEREFLTFAPKEKSIAYAGSFGIDTLPKQVRQRYTENLKGFSHISVREDAAAKIVNDCIGVMPKVVCDPTMLITKKDWLQKSQKPKIDIKKPFIIKYFLGQTDDAYIRFIDEFAYQKGAAIININSMDSLGINIGPFEFVWLFQKCFCAFVDSYHGSVFSVIFQKPFLVFERAYEEGAGQMNSRINTLLSTFKLSEQYIVNEKQLNENCMFIDYEKKNIEEILKEKRKEAENYIKESLNLE